MFRFGFVVSLVLYRFFLNKIYNIDLELCLYTIIIVFGFGFGFVWVLFWVFVSLV